MRSCRRLFGRGTTCKENTWVCTRARASDPSSIPLSRAASTLEMQLLLGTQRQESTMFKLVPSSAVIFLLCSGCFGELTNEE